MAEPRRSGQDHTEANEADEMDYRLDDNKPRRSVASRTVMPQPLEGPKTERSYDQAEVDLLVVPKDRSIRGGGEVHWDQGHTLKSVYNARSEEQSIAGGDEVHWELGDKMKSVATQRSAGAISLSNLQREVVPSKPQGHPPVPKRNPCPAPLPPSPIWKQDQSLFRSPFGPYFSEGKNGVQELPTLFHLECTNLVIKAPDGRLSFETLDYALRLTLKQTNIDILDFVSEHAVGNRFMSLFVRVFEPPPESSGQLLDNHDIIESKIAGGLLVEVQLREGDRLYFSSLFREIQDNLKKQDLLIVTGILRYEPKSYPDKGEGLKLESLPDHQPSSFDMGGMYQGAIEIEESDSCESMDEDMIEDVVKLAEALQSKYLDVQADAATAVAGLTSDDEFLKQLADPKAEKAAKELCSAAARLLAETDYRPARRQAAVAVANLSTLPMLCLLLLASDPPLPKRSEPLSATYKRGLVDALVTLSMLRSNEGKEEEIGTRRECMRALVEMAKIERTKYLQPMVDLRKSKPSGKGSEDDTLMKRLDDCRSILNFGFRPVS